MKKHSLCLLPLACTVMLATGCAPERQWDYYNTDIVIELRDSQGWNWFDSRRPDGNLRNSDVEILYDGATYDLKYLDPNTRAAERDLPEWTENGRNPFRYSGYFETENSRIRLLFGEFSADTKNYRGETFTIDWGNGTESVVKFDLYAISNGKNKEPSIHEAIWVESGIGAGTRSDNLLVLIIDKD